MEESNNLLTALQAMLAMKTVMDESATSPEPGSSISVPSSSSARKRPHEGVNSNPPKKPRLEHSVQKSVGNTFSTIGIPVGTSRDLTVFLEQAKK